MPPRVVSRPVKSNQFEISEPERQSDQGPLGTSSKERQYESERIAYRSREWLQDLQYQADKPMEEALEKGTHAILPELVKNVEKYQNWGIAYQTSREIDDYFLEWGRLYLRRMWGQDLVGLDDRIVAPVDITSILAYSSDWPEELRNIYVTLLS
ncbi:MAG: hypothetical protein R3C97_16600 [Geminicoccaceae bacterium]